MIGRLDELPLSPPCHVTSSLPHLVVAVAAPGRVAHRRWPRYLVHAAAPAPMGCFPRWAGPTIAGRPGTVRRFLISHFLLIFFEIMYNILKCVENKIKPVKIQNKFPLNTFYYILAIGSTKSCFEYYFLVENLQ
jgi:hypothetical protein